MEPIETRSASRCKLLVASAPEIFAAMRDPARVARRWGPTWLTNTIHRYELEPGGKRLLTMHGPNGKGCPKETPRPEVGRPLRYASLSRGAADVAPLALSVGEHCHDDNSRDLRMPGASATADRLVLRQTLQ